MQQASVPLSYHHNVSTTPTAPPVVQATFFKEVSPSNILRCSITILEISNAIEDLVELLTSEQRKEFLLQLCAVDGHVYKLRGLLSNTTRRTI